MGFVRCAWIVTAFAVAGAGCTVKTSSSSGGGTPQEVADAMLAAVKKDQPQRLWELLPTSYQKDLKDVLSLVADSFDETLYNDGMKLANGFGRLLGEKSDWIATHPMVGMIASQGGASAEQLKASIKSAGAIIHSLCESEIKTKSGLKQLDVGSFLSRNGAKLMAEAKKAVSAIPMPDGAPGAITLAKLDSMKIEVVQSSGDAATLRVTTTGEPPEELKLVKVEGKWVPEPLAKDWSAKVAEMKQDLAKSTAMSPEDLAKAKMQVGQANQVISQLLAAKSQEEFNATIQGLMGMMMGGG